MCGTWFSLDDILKNPVVTPIGMMLECDDPQRNYLFFNHSIDECQSTFAISVTEFEALIVEKIPDEILFGREQCNGHCATMYDISACRSACRWAPYRRFLLRLMKSRELPVDRL